MQELVEQFADIIKFGEVQISTIKPSDWTEQNVLMGKPKPGLFRYDYTPYTREIIDRLAPDDPAREVYVIKGSQAGMSSGVIMPGLGWMIKNNPGNTYLMVGAPDLVEKAVEKLDLMIDGAGLRGYIRPQVLRNRANKSGDTNLKKDFAGGYISIGSANNHKAIAQVDLQFIFLDDLDAMKGASATSGDFVDLIRQRAAAYKNSYKLFGISTPLLEKTSIIKPLVLTGDQRRWFIECPCCHEPIIFKWSFEEGDIINPLKSDVAKGKGGFVWQTNNNGQVVSSSVGFVCYKCAGFFNDKNKYQMLNGGFWDPTAIAVRPDTYSYYLPSLYSPIGMFDWVHYVNQYVNANPEGQKRNERKYQTFANTVLGETYEELAESPKANVLQMNIRNYDIGVIPESLSIKDGNGKIVLVTCAADLNGVEEDARLDWEIWAWSETGASYAINHGSIGTFIPRENSKINKEDRERWNYYKSKQNSVWPYFDALISQVLETDTGRKMKVMITGVDTGHYSEKAYEYIDNTNNFVVALKGDKDGKYRAFGVDTPKFKPAKERGNLFILEVNQLKDELSSAIEIKWDSGNDKYQPYGFLNFPLPGDGKYLFQNYFVHYEAEHRVVETKEGEGVSARWVKKNFSVQNHFWDVRIYNMAVRDIFVVNITKESGIVKGSWADYVRIINGL